MLTSILHLWYPAIFGAPAPTSGTVLNSNHYFKFTPAVYFGSTLYPVTDHEFRYKIVGGNYTAWTTCKLSNTINNGDSTFSLVLPNANISANNVQIRVRSINGARVGKVLANASDFTETFGAPSITAQPYVYELTGGNTLNLKAEFANAPTSYQWYKDTVAISGATSDIYQNTNSKASNEGTYYVIATNSYGSVQSFDYIVKYTSLNGCTSDATLELGSTTFGTDNTTTLQSILDTYGGSSNLILIVDGAYSITQIKIPGNVQLFGTSDTTTGFICRDNTNKPPIVNKNRTVSTTFIDENIRIDNLTMNCNAFRADVEYQTKETSEGWTTGLRFAGVRNFNSRKIRIINQRSFASFFNNFENIRFTDPYSQAYSKVNQDGFKNLGPGFGAYYKNITVNGMGDDAVSFCSNDIFWPTSPAPTPQYGGQTAYDPYATYGDIDNCEIDGITSTNSRFCVRLLSLDKKVKNVNAINLNVSTKDTAMIIDNYDEGPENLYGVLAYDVGHFENINIDTSSITITDTASYKNAYIYVSAGDVSILNVRNITRLGYNSTTVPIPTIKVTKYGLIQQLNVENYQLHSTSSTEVIESIRNEGIIKNLNIVDSSISFNNYASNQASHLIKNLGTINNLTLNGVSVSGVTYAIESFTGNIDNFSYAEVTTGTGVLCNVAASSDPVAAYVAAENISGSELTALNALVTSIKAAGNAWNKMLFFKPGLGTQSKDLRKSYAPDIVFNGCTLSGNKIDYNGTTDYASWGFVANKLDPYINDLAVLYRTDETTYASTYSADFGQKVYDNSAPFYMRAVAGSQQLGMAAGNPTTNFTTTTGGNAMVIKRAKPYDNRKSIIFVGTTKINTFNEAATTTSLGSSDLIMGGAADTFSNRRTLIAAVFKELTDDEAVAVLTAVNTFCTAVK